MNYELMQKHIDAFVASIPCVEMETDGSNAVDFYVADLVSDRKFAQNYGGYPRSDIAEINECASLEMQKVLLQNMQDFRASADGQNAGRTDAQIMLGHKSKYCQTPNEMIDWTCEQIKISQEMRAAELARIEKLRSVQQQNIMFKPADNPQIKSDE